LSFRASQVCNI